MQLKLKKKKDLHFTVNSDDAFAQESEVTAYTVEVTGATECSDMEDVHERCSRVEDENVEG